MEFRWVRNMLTMGDLICGFVSALSARFNTSEGHIGAVLLIFLAVLLEGLDGQAARWLGVSCPIRFAHCSGRLGRMPP